MPDVNDPADPYAGAETVHEQSLADSLFETPQPGGGPHPTREFPAYGQPGPASPGSYQGSPQQPPSYQPSQQPSSYPQPHYQQPPYQPPVTTLPPAKGNTDRRRGWLIAGGAFLVVAALATTLVLVPQRTGDSGTAAVTTDITSAPLTAGPPESARPTVTAESKALPTRSIGASTTAAATSAAPVSTAPVSTAAADLPLGGPRVDIPCAEGYIVQIASELDPASFEQRVGELRAANQLPADARWTEANASCAIFTSQVNVLVLYAGPYATPYDACPARLAAPPDAFIKGTTPASASSYVSCLCPAAADQLPAITAVGQQGVWVGELQRVLGTGLDLDVGSINADASIGYAGSWGIYTEDTANAVGQFQAASGLPANNQVDAATWSALQSATC